MFFCFYFNSSHTICRSNKVESAPDASTSSKYVLISFFAHQFCKNYDIPMEINGWTGSLTFLHRFSSAGDLLSIAIYGVVGVQQTPDPNWTRKVIGAKSPTRDTRPN